MRIVSSLRWLVRRAGLEVVRVRLDKLVLRVSDNFGNDV